MTEKGNSMMEWVKVGRNEEFSVGLHDVRIGERRIVLAVLEGEVFAFAPFCPHASGPMHLAEVEGTVIACPLHAWRFDLRDNGTEIHGFRALTMHDVQVDHGTISVALQQLQPAASPA